MPDRSLDAIAPLADPVRRALYAWVVLQPSAVDRDAAAEAISITRPLAAFHLDRLVRDGLLVAEYHRRTGRSGPGAGRPAKFYRRSPDREIEVALPPRRYAVVAEVLAAGVEASDAAREAALASAALRGEAEGRRLAGLGQPLLDGLADAGYEPTAEADGSISLRNCPFHAVVEEHRDLVCSMNLALLSALATASGSPRAAHLAPAPGRCCVVLDPPVDTGR